jgi:hypothetical protein
MSGRRILGAVLCAIAVTYVLTGCGDSESSGSEPSAFESALGTLGLTDERTSFGWDEIDALRGYPVDPDFGADALGPGVTYLVDREARIFHATGFAPSYSGMALSEDGPPGSGVRFDKANPGNLVDLLLDAGARTSREGPWHLFDLVPADRGVTGPLAAFGPLISYVAISADAVVFADAEPIRASLTGDGGSFDPPPALLAALECLGKAVAARTVPASSAGFPAAPKVLAVGVRPLSEDVPPHDVACAIDDSAERSDNQAEAMRAALPDATVSRESAGDLEVARLEIEPGDGEKPSALLRAYAHGEVLGFLGLEGAG